MPSFVKVAAGDYETFGGRFRLYRLQGVYPPAWNVEDTEADVWVSGQDTEDVIVDGAGTMRDAYALFQEWHERKYGTRGRTPRAESTSIPKEG